MGRQIAAHHNTQVVVRYAGEHQTNVEILLDVLRITLPGLVVTITDVRAIWSIWKAWHEAASHARNVFNDLSAASYLVSPVTTIHTAVRISGWQPGRQVWGKTPNHSTSGCGELRVRVGGLVIICDDRAAFDRQLATWAMAYDTGRRKIWPGVIGMDS